MTTLIRKENSRVEIELPLQGIRVIEVCNVAAGPYCGLLLADMGADVIKVENPEGGDTLRSWPPISDGHSENFASLNRNKRSVTLNLKVPSDLELLRRLAAEADVLIENNRPGVMDRLGAGYTQIQALNPRLVYCSISAYGQSGPRAQEGGFDLTVQAMSGIMSVTGEPGRPPVKCGVPIADFAAGLYGAFSIVSALRMAEATGQVDAVKNALYLLGEAANLSGDGSLAREHFTRLQQEFFPDATYLPGFLLAVDVRKLINLHA